MPMSFGQGLQSIVCMLSLDTPDLVGAPRMVPQLHARGKRYTSDAFHIRVLLLADHSVRQHHKSRRDAEQYLLAIMNIVSGMVEVACDVVEAHATAANLTGLCFERYSQLQMVEGE